MRYYCYVHAVEAGLLEGPLGLLTAVAANTGYPTNAVVFVIEALSQHGCLTEVDGLRPMWSIAAPTKTAEQFCISIRLATIERFDFHDTLVLKHWNLIRAKDIGLLLSGLERSSVLALQQGHANHVLRDLRVLDRELLTFPYDEY